MLKIEDFRPGNYYHVQWAKDMALIVRIKNYLRGYEFRLSYINAVSKNYFTDTTLTIGDKEVRIATPDEIAWHQACANVMKFVPFDRIPKNLGTENYSVFN